MKTIYFNKGDSYPEPELTNSAQAMYKLETSDEDFDFICKAANDWKRARALLLKLGKTIKKKNDLSFY